MVKPNSPLPIESRLTMRVPEKVHRYLKDYAAHQGITVTYLVLRAIRLMSTFDAASRSGDKILLVKENGETKEIVLW